MQKGLKMKLYQQSFILFKPDRLDPILNTFTISVTKLKGQHIQMQLLTLHPLMLLLVRMCHYPD